MLLRGNHHPTLPLLCALYPHSPPHVPRAPLPAGSCAVCLAVPARCTCGSCAPELVVSYRCPFGAAKHLL